MKGPGRFQASDSLVCLSRLGTVLSYFGFCSMLMISSPLLSNHQVTNLPEEPICAWQFP
jgi:hypothetical protein